MWQKSACGFAEHNTHFRPLKKNNNRFLSLSKYIAAFISVCCFFLVRFSIVVPLTCLLQHWCQTNVLTRIKVLCYQAFHHTACCLLAWNMSIPNKELFIGWPLWRPDGSFVVVLTVMSACGSLHSTFCPLYYNCANISREDYDILAMSNVLDLVETSELVSKWSNLICVSWFCLEQSQKYPQKQLHNTSLHRLDVIWYWRRIAAHSPYKRHVLYWSKSISAVCLAHSVRAQQTRWIMQSWLWVTALKRTARHIGLWRTLGAQPGERTGKYSLRLYVCISLWWPVTAFRPHGRLSFSFHQIFFDRARKKHVRTGCMLFLPSTFRLRSNTATKWRMKPRDNMNGGGNVRGSLCFHVPWSVLCESLISQQYVQYRQIRSSQCSYK